MNVTSALFASKLATSRFDAKRIAVWNTAFLGDAVLTLPLLGSLRRRFPAAHITFYVRSGVAPLFTSNPVVDSVITYDKRGGVGGIVAMAAFARSIAQQRHDLWISAHTSIRSGIMALVSGAPVRIGYTGAHSGLCYTHQVSRRFGELDEVERLLLLLQPLEIPATVVWPEIVLSSEDHEAADTFFASLSGPVLGLHPGSTWGTKKWPTANFANIGIRALTHGAHVILFAGPGEESVASEVEFAIMSGVDEKICAARLHNLSGRLSLPRLAAYLGRLCCYVTNDSGPMHLAWAQKTPVTAIFGPTTRDLGFFPRGEGSTVFEANVACRPCGLHGPKACPLGHHHCMVDVLPEGVWGDVASKLLK